ncbi:hypothetical protein GS429_21410 [Natronorubrum sp. JWXQ-INN-674]|uniref:Uncharacterized protein n=1 Tax=Natronorubrum halalkaliphilum TaxID=2691917 RepID=A0A6B0VT98_9EURY|nr:hypothetical protein [Natronorubrum halalkaliphilum]MXV64584.1 hypothetical protein [Natronorubrum halalkaliphilum]
MANLERRKVLEFSTIPILSLTSGCLSRFSNDNGQNEVSFCEVTIANEDTESHTASVELVEAGEVAHSDSYELPSIEKLDQSAEGDTYVETDGFSTSNGQRKGEYSLRVKVNGGDWSEIDLTKENSDPVSVLVTIQSVANVSFFVQTDTESECS